MKKHFVNGRDILALGCSRHFLRWVIAAVLVLATESAANSQTVDAQLFDNFDDGDLISVSGWSWRVFAKDEVPSLTVSTPGSEGGGNSLLIDGKLPDDGTGFTYGGLLCTGDIAKTGPLDFGNYYAFRFRAASDVPSYYSVRLEQEGLGYNSTNVIFPVTDTMQVVMIPIGKFVTGTNRTTAFAFTRIVDTPGDTFHLMLDDVELVESQPNDWSAIQWDGVVSWAPTLEIAWQNARFDGKPMLAYFSSDYAAPCRAFEAQLLKAKGFPALAQQFVLAKISVSERWDLTSRYKVLKVPTFLVFDPVNAEGTPLYIGENPGTLQNEMRRYLESQKNADTKSSTVPADKYQVVTIDSFSDRNDLNDVGGSWGTFSAGDRGDIIRRFVDLGGGNLAIEARGGYPSTENGTTWGGLYCDLAPTREVRRNLASFRWLSFVCKSEKPGTYQVHFENGPEIHSEPALFQVSETPARVTIPISHFGSVANAVTTIVWSEPSPMPNTQFDLVLDDVMAIR